MSVTVTTQAELDARTAFRVGLRLGRMILVSDNGCWLWTGYTTPAGYGRTMGREAHRVIYEFAVGPTDLHLDHLCRVRNCVNPTHLEPVTQAENNRRQGAAATHCRNGHEWTPDNTLHDTRGTRRCRACSRARCVRYRSRPLGDVEAVAS